MTETSAARPAFKAAPPTKRAKLDGIAVRLYEGSLVAHVSKELGDRLMAAGIAEALRSGPRRYLRLGEGIRVPRTVRGWDVIESLRTWHGDKKAAEYVAHKDRESERLRYRQPSRTSEGPRHRQAAK